MAPGRSGGVVGGRSTSGASHTDETPSPSLPSSVSPIVQALLAAAASGGIAASKDDLRKLSAAEQEAMRRQLGELLQSVGGAAL
jgi:hypothetical protein